MTRRQVVACVLVPLASILYACGSEPVAQDTQKSFSDCVPTSSERAAQEAADDFVNVYFGDPLSTGYTHAGVSERDGGYVVLVTGRVGIDGPDCRSGIPVQYEAGGPLAGAP